MSDSESSQEVETKTELKMEGKLRDLLEKGKLITPKYDVSIASFRMRLCSSSINNVTAQTTSF